MSEADSKAKGNLVVRQHTVPAFYLRAFASDTEQRSVIGYDKKTCIAKALQIKDASVVRRIYSYKRSDGCWDDKFEKLLSRIETDAALGIKSLQRGAYPTPAERFHVSYLVAMQMRRTLAQRMNVRNSVEAFWTDKNKVLAWLDKERNRITRKFSESEFDDYRERVASGDVPIPDTNGSMRAAEYSVTVETLPTLADHVECLHWQIVKARKPHYFVTSDEPAFVRRQGSDLDNGIVGISRKDLNAELVFPLSPRYLLLCTHREAANKVSASKTRVKELNKTIIRMANRWVFASEESPALLHLVEAFSETTTPVPTLEL